MCKSKKSDHENVDTENITDNKTFYVTVRLFFPNKVRSNTYIKIEKDEKDENFLIHKYKIANIFNNFFINLFQISARKSMKNIYVMLATFLTQFKNLHEDINNI